MDRINPNAIVFENSEKEFVKLILESNSDFTKDDVRKLVDSGMLKAADGNKFIMRTENSSIKMSKDIKNNILHKKALLAMAKDKDDPLYNKMVKLFEDQQKIYDELESKYGDEATINQNTIINKLMSKFKFDSSFAAVECTKKLKEFDI